MERLFEISRNMSRLTDDVSLRFRIATFIFSQTNNFFHCKYQIDSHGCTKPNGTFKLTLNSCEFTSSEVYVSSKSTYIFL